MAEKKITVVIDGQEFVSKAADDASAGMDRFAKKQPGWVNGLADLKAGWEFLSKGIGFVRSAIENSLSAYDALVVSQRKMEGASKLTGLSLDYLHGIAAEGREKFGLSTVTANEYAVEMAKLEKVSGGASKATDLLSGFLEIGAARGLTAAESLQAAQQSILGIDEGTDKLFGKNPSGLWADYEQVIGKSAGKFSDMEKQAALAYAVIEGGNATLGSYAAVLDSTAGKTELFKQKNQEAAAALGESMGVIRGKLVDVGGTTVPWFYDAWRRNFDGISSVIFNAENTLDRWMLAIYKVVGTDAQVAEYTEKSRVSFDKMKLYYDRSKMSAEELAKQNAKVTGSLKDVIPQAGGATAAFGGLIQPLGASTFAAKETADAVGSIGPRANMTAKEVDAYGKMSVKTSKEVKDEAKKAKEEWEAVLKSHKESYDRIAAAYEAYFKLLPKLQPALKEAMQTQHIDSQNKALVASKEAADAAFKAIKDGATPLPPLIKKAGDTVGEMGVKLSDAAGFVLDVSDEFGGLDKEAQTVLTSVQTIGASVQDMMKGGLSFAGVAGILGAVGAIVNALTSGSRERKLLELESQSRLRDNTTQMQALTRQMGQLNLDVSGATVSGVETVLADILQYPGLMDSRDPFAREQILFNLLNDKGITKADFFDLAKKFGMNLVDKNGNIDWKQLPTFLATLKGTNTASPGNDFSSRLDILKSGFSVNNTGSVDQIGQLLGLGGTFSDTLKGVFNANDLGGTRTKLQGLFNDLSAGRLTESQLGGLTGSQFLSLLTDVIARIDSLGTSTGTGGGTAVGGGTSSITSGGVTVATKTLADVLDGVNAQTTALGAYHVKHLDIATAHLAEAKTQTVILSDIADSVRPLRDGITNIADKGLEAERLALAAERGLGASY